MRIKSILIATCLLLTVGCQSKEVHNQATEKDNQISNLEERIKQKDAIIDEMNLKLEKIEKQNRQLSSELTQTKQMLDNLIEDYEVMKSNQTEMNFELWGYESVYDEYKEFIYSSLDEKPEINEDNASISEVHIGDNYKDVLSRYGERYNEDVLVDELNGGGIIRWTYESGKVVRFDPIYVENIETEDSKDVTNFGIKVGDYALDAIQYCDSNFKKFESVEYSEPLLGWYITDKGNLLILYFNKEKNRIQQDIEVTEKTKVWKIELSTRELFD